MPPTRSTGLRAVPDVPPRAVAYVRVSTERDDMISPELQLAAIREHCDRHGYVLLEPPLIDPGSTGRLWKRRQVEQAVAMLEAAAADVIVVWKLSRISRQRRDWAVAIDRIETAGGRLESATEPIDTTTSSGRFARGVLAELAAFESERIGETWKETHARRLRNGRPINGRPRWGYRYVDKAHEPDPETGPVLAEAYHRYVAGESMYALVKWLNDAGHRTVGGYSKKGPGPWSDVTLRRVLDSGFGAGQLLVAGEHRPGAHTPVIDNATWQAYLAARARRAAPAQRTTERSQYLLSGLVRCVCGSKMSGGQFGHRRTPKFRCAAGQQERRHTGGYVTMTVVEVTVVEWLRELADDVDQATDSAAAAAAHRTRRRTDTDLIRREIRAVDDQLTRLTLLAAKVDMPAAEYAAARGELVTQRDALVARERQAAVDAGAADAPLAAAQLLAEWDVLPVTARRESLRRLLDHVEVTPGRPRSIVRVRPRWPPSQDAEESR